MKPFSFGKTGSAIVFVMGLVLFVFAITTMEFEKSGWALTVASLFVMFRGVFDWVKASKAKD